MQNGLLFQQFEQRGALDNKINGSRQQKIHLTQRIKNCPCFKYNEGLVRKNLFVDRMFFCKQEQRSNQILFLNQQVMSQSSERFGEGSQFLNFSRERGKPRRLISIQDRLFPTDDDLLEKCHTWSILMAPIGLDLIELGEVEVGQLLLKPVRDQSKVAVVKEEISSQSIQGQHKIKRSVKLPKKKRNIKPKKEQELIKQEQSKMHQQVNDAFPMLKHEIKDQKVKQEEFSYQYDQFWDLLE